MLDLLNLLRRFNPHKRQKLDIGLVLIVNAADCRRDLDEHPSDDQRIALITRLGTASRSAGLNADKLYTEEPYGDGKPSGGARDHAK